jgi:hypothetical protein
VLPEPYEGVEYALVGIAVGVELAIIVGDELIIMGENEISPDVITPEPPRLPAVALIIALARQ